MRLPKPFHRLVPARFRARTPLVPVVRLAGPIGIPMPFRQSLSLATLAVRLQAAFSIPDIKAVALTINSPGGSAVQSHLIMRRIRALAEEKKVSVFAFAEDAAASGGYMLALAADEIFVDPASIVGSIGVVAAGFGFDKLIERIGIDRRVYAAGEEKVILDPFRPERDADVERLKRVQGLIHAHFIDLVKERRGARLKGDDATLFSGAFWTGAEAVDLGLADGIGDLRAVMRERFGEKVQLRLVEGPRPFGLGRLLGASAETAARFDAGALLAAVEDRALWSRYGL
ncbi:S49 family peptidase [Chelatococcus sp. SYSU_G07232]|uniref:S49 family peptidase n=1 Tax=Chelatococcus albus TaxID=3047466 RepID=A0ABT7AG34_9HYPH|nr:S49 family peptidase [Chelatococcus sp. SYSU_G07232]MDJ1157809.1 S49 family peptidase [Chelatococcus sp. SYSU_G07232]